MNSTSQKNYTLPIIMMVAIVLYDLVRDRFAESVRGNC